MTIVLQKAQAAMLVLHREALGSQFGGVEALLLEEFVNAGKVVALRRFHQLFVILAPLGQLQTDMLQEMVMI